VIKADGTWGGKGVTIASSGTEASEAFAAFSSQPSILKLITKLLLNRDRDWTLFDWNHSRRSVIAQAMITGRPANCAVVCWKGKILAGIAVEVIQSRGTVGPATVVQIVPGAEMLVAAQRIARRLQLSGFFGLDFMIERNTGSVYLIEMNPRCTPPSPLPLGEGRDLASAIWTQLTGGSQSLDQPIIKQKTIAYFPQTTEQSIDFVSDGSVYRDIPMDEPELVQELLRPKSERSVLGRLIDLTRKKEPQQVSSILCSMDQKRV
jgi:carbamoylphosphate synthase large subunit